jgi:hypothetical protein
MSRPCAILLVFASCHDRHDRPTPFPHRGLWHHADTRLGPGKRLTRGPTRDLLAVLPNSITTSTLAAAPKFAIAPIPNVPTPRRPPLVVLAHDRPAGAVSLPTCCTRFLLGVPKKSRRWGHATGILAATSVAGKTGRLNRFDAHGGEWRRTPLQCRSDTFPRPFSFPWAPR